MANIINTLYPPLIDTFMPAFPYNEKVTVYFSISPYNSSNNITYVHVTLVNQKTNQNVLVPSIPKNNDDDDIKGIILNGIWIIPFSSLKYDLNTGLYSFSIPATLLKESKYQIDSYYKLQLRFDNSSKTLENQTSDYLINNRQNFSEWSSVCLLKAIPKIEVSLQGFTSMQELFQNNELEQVPQFVPGVIPFTGRLIYYNEENKNIQENNSEYLLSYQIQIFDFIGELLKDSGTLYPSQIKKTSEFYWLCDLTQMTTGTQYKVKISFNTSNQYQFSKEYKFRLVNSLDIGFNPTISFNKKSLFNHGNYEEALITEEDGWVELTVQNSGNISPGYLFIKRATSLDNFQQWELIDCSFTNGQEISKTIIDKTVGSLIRYKYACQYRTQKGSWSRTTISQEIVYPNFYDILLTRGDKQLAIRYNGQIMNMTPVVNRVKIDTLGGRYPKFAENAKLKYKQFQLNGLITAESDYNRTFLNDLDYTDEMKIYDDQFGGTYEIRNDTVVENGITYQADIVAADTTTRQLMRDTQKNTRHDLYPTNNWWWERKFREEVIDWLNDGEPKLYRSMAEGNMIVMIDGISLTPNQQLGRRIWNFSCTVYEVGDGNSLSQLNSLGIYDVNDDFNNSSIDKNNINDISETSGDLIIKTIGQSFKIKAKNITNASPLIVRTAENNNSTINDGWTVFQDIFAIDSDNNIINYDETDIGILKQPSLFENLNLLYGEGVYENYVIKNQNIWLTDVKIQFESEPQWYDLSEEEPTFVDLLLDTEDSIKDNFTIERQLNLNYKMGYKLKLTSLDKLPFFVFVNQYGYYQIPSNILVSEIELFDGAEATIDYIINCTANYFDKEEPNSYEFTDTIIGQVSENWNAETSVAEFINNKYLANYSQNNLQTIYSLNSWEGISFEGTPYTILKIQWAETKEYQTFIVGRSGVLDLLNDYQISDLIIEGKRMIKVDISRQKYLDEWECVLENLQNENTWIVYDLNTYQPIKVSSTEPNFITKWYNDDINNITFEIEELNPIYNTIYPITNPQNTIDYKIYYLNKGWFNISFDETHPDICYAKVPIDGMINYKASILKQVFEIQEF